MPANFKRAALSATGVLFLASLCFAQTSTIEGDVKGPDGQPLKGAIVKIDRTDIKGKYQTKSDKKGHYLHVGLPLGTYNVTCEVDGKPVDNVNGVRTRPGDSTVIDFDLQKTAQKQQALTKAAETGTLTKEQEREMSPEQRAMLKKKAEEQAAAMKKNKELNDAYNAGIAAIESKQWDAAVQNLSKASELDPKQIAVWSHLAEAYAGLAGTKVGSEQDPILAKAMEAYGKALELSPNDAALHNNYALLLVKTKKLPEAQAELAKAAQLDPTKAGQYFYNLGAVLTNTGQAEPAGEAFKKATEVQPDYAEAHYQYAIYLIGKAKTTPDGKVIPVEGTKEEFQKYLQLAPNGPNAASAKAMLDSMDVKLTTGYETPNAPTKKGKKK